MPILLGGIGAAVVVAALVLVAVLSGPTSTIPTASGGSSTPVALHLVNAAPTANDTVASLPSSVRDVLYELADAHESVAITRIEGDGTTNTYTVDMTPRTGNNPSDPILTVPERADDSTKEKIAAIEEELNAPASIGGRSLFRGLTRIDFTGVPVVIVSSLIDFSSPTDFRTLNWSVSPARVVKTAGNSLPDINGPVTYVVVPTGGSQLELGAEEKIWAKKVWTAILLSSNSDQVTFVDAVANPGTPDRDAPNAPVVDPKPLPDTPIPLVPEPGDPSSASCTLSGSYFKYASPDLADRDLTMGNLSGCIEKALASCATFEVHGWASYEGELTPEGLPTHNDPDNQKYSDDRVAATVALLTTEFAVPAEDILVTKGHGNLDLPVPTDPSSADNRVVRIAYTAPATGCNGAGR